MAIEKVQLIPWDPKDEEHYQRMYDQRVACGWRTDEVAEWKQKQLRGTKVHYWIVLSDNLPNRDGLLAKHVEKYPVEMEPLTDTLKSVNGSKRTPRGKKFIPVGHTALECCPDLVTRFGFPESIIKITSLYISWPLQSGGIGRSAMAQTERIAAQPPYNCTLVILDTAQRETQLSEGYLQALYDARGMERPEKLLSNEDWYLRLGYDVFHKDKSGIFAWTVPTTGEIFPIPIVWMKKEIVN